MQILTDLIQTLKNKEIIQKNYICECVKSDQTKCGHMTPSNIALGKSDWKCPDCHQPLEGNKDNQKKILEEVQSQATIIQYLKQEFDKIIEMPWYSRLDAIGLINQKPYLLEFKRLGGSSPKDLNLPFEGYAIKSDQLRTITNLKLPHPYIIIYYKIKNQKASIILAHHSTYQHTNNETYQERKWQDNYNTFINISKFQTIQKLNKKMKSFKKWLSEI